MSANREEMKLRIINKKLMPDGALLEKIETIDQYGIERSFSVNGVKVAEILERMNFKKGESEWLSLDYSMSRVCK